jgi:hypothetical protein
VDVEMYFDDVSIVPADAGGEEPYSDVELNPEKAALGSGARLEPLHDFPQWTTIRGPGTAAWRAS